MLKITELIIYKSHELNIIKLSSIYYLGLSHVGNHTKTGLHDSYWSAFAILDHGLHRVVGYLLAGRGVIIIPQENNISQRFSAIHRAQTRDIMSFEKG